MGQANAVGSRAVFSNLTIVQTYLLTALPLNTNVMSVCLFPLYLLKRLIFDLDLVHVYGSLPYLACH